MAYEVAAAFIREQGGTCEWSGSRWFVTHADGRAIKFGFDGVCPLDALTEPTGLPRPNHERPTPAAQAEYEAMFDRDDVERVD
jgi:hypothetical protein